MTHRRKRRNRYFRRNELAETKEEKIPENTAVTHAVSMEEPTIEH